MARRRSATRGADLKARRIELGWAQQDLADYLDYTRPHLSTLENSEDPVPRVLELAMKSVPPRSEMDQR